MLYSYLECIPICVIIYCVLNIKKKDYFWNILISIGILPFVALVFTSIYSALNGSGLVGDKGGLDSGVFAFVVCLLYFWYVYIGAIALLIFSINKRKKNINEKKKLSVIEKSIIIALMVTNIVFILNWFSVDIIDRPLFLYRLFNISDNIFYGIGVTVRKIDETGISYNVDFISLISFLCIFFAITFIFLKIKNQKSNIYKND